MPGGARARSGPPPDPNALRRDRPSDIASWTHLPAAGRTAPAPAWPLTRASARETEHWIREWARPQAVMWERHELEVEVALYVRNLAKVERPKAATGLGTLVKQQQEALGLSLPGLARLRWIIDHVPQQVNRPDDPDRARAKSRFKTLEGGSSAS